MSMPKALIAQAHPKILAAKAQQILAGEITKGCGPDLSPEPVSLEPPYQDLMLFKHHPEAMPPSDCLAEAAPHPDELIRLQAWISPDHALDWKRCESFLKQIQTISHRMGFEVRGNNREVVISFLCHKVDAPILLAAFQGEYQKCELAPMIAQHPFLSDDDTEQIWRFRDYYPQPPYSHLLTCPGELRSSPLETLLNALSIIEPPDEGLYQAIFQPVPPGHNWHQNVEVLLDLEFAVKLVSGFQTWQRYAQQAPSGDLRQMSWEVTSKAHNDKPFYFLALRVAVLGAKKRAEEWLGALAVFISLFQHGGRPISYITHEDYGVDFTPPQIQAMFELGLAYRPGFLVNSLELTGPVHLPPLDIKEYRPVSMNELDRLSCRNAIEGPGTLIGFSNFAGQAIPVSISPQLRERHTHTIGKPGTGKSTLMEHMALADIEAGHGVAILDPHGDLVERMLCAIPKDKIENTIYFNPGDPDWVPIWNPFDHKPGQDVGRTADDMVRAIQSFVTSGSWGDRMEHILRNICFSLIPLKHSTIFDLANLLRNKSEESSYLRKEILKVVDNESVRQFWRHDFERYGKDDMGPPRNKLSKLLVTGTVSLMLSQPDSRIDFRQIMDEGKILLVNLSMIGSMVREILGCFILSPAPLERAQP